MKHLVPSFVDKMRNRPGTWSMLDQGVASGGNFLLSMVIARWLGVAEFGLFSLWYFVPLFVLSLHQAFITQPMQVFLPQLKEEQQMAYATNTWGLQLILGAILLLVGGIWSWWSFTYFPVLSALLAAFLSMHDFFRKYAYILGWYRFPLVIDTLLYALIFLGLLLLDYLAYESLAGVLILLTMAYFLATMIAVVHLKIRHQKLVFAEVKALFKKHYHFSIWLLGAALVQWWAGNAFVLAGAALMGTAAFGIFRLAQQLVGLCHVLFLAMENTVPVAAAQHFIRTGRRGLFVYLKKISFQFGGLTLLVLMIIAVWGAELARILLGEVTAGIAPLLYAFVALYVLVFLNIPLRIALRTLQQTQPVFIAYALSALVGVFLAYPLVRNYGIHGVFMGLMLTQMVNLSCFYWSIHFSSSTFLTQFFVKK